MNFFKYYVKIGLLLVMLGLIGILLTMAFYAPVEAKIGLSTILGSVFGGIGIAFIVKGKNPYYRQQAELDEIREQQKKKQTLPAEHYKDKQAEYDKDQAEFAKIKQAQGKTLPKGFTFISSDKANEFLKTYQSREAKMREELNQQHFMERGKPTPYKEGRGTLPKGFSNDPYDNFYETLTSERKHKQPRTFHKLMLAFGLIKEKKREP